METTCCVQTTSAEEKGLIYEELKEQYHLVLDVECMNLLYMRTTHLKARLCTDRSYDS